MGNNHTVALRRKLIGVAGERIETVRRVKLFRVVSRAISEIGIDHTIFVHSVGVALAVGRKIPGEGFPFHVGDPGDLFAGDVHQRDIHVTALSIRAKQESSIVSAPLGPNTPWRLEYHDPAARSSTGSSSISGRCPMQYGNETIESMIYLLPYKT